MMSCAAFAEKLERAAIAAKREIEAPTDALMIMVEAQAKEAIGGYRYGWQELAESTQDDRERKGYSRDEPLLRTGALHDSIHSRAELTPYGAAGVVYSDDMIAAYQEMGTDRIPPRPFLFKSLWLATPFMAKLFRDFAIKILTIG